MFKSQLFVLVGVLCFALSSQAVAAPSPIMMCAQDDSTQMNYVVGLAQDSGQFIGKKSFVDSEDFPYIFSYKNQCGIVLDKINRDRLFTFKFNFWNAQKGLWWPSGHANNLSVPTGFGISTTTQIMADSNEGSIAWSLLYDKSASLEVYSLEQWKATLHAELTGFTKSYQNGPFYVPPYYYYRGDGFQLYRMDAKTGVTAKFATITQSPRIPWAQFPSFFADGVGNNGESIIFGAAAAQGNVSLFQVLCPASTPGSCTMDVTRVVIKVPMGFGIQTTVVYFDSTTRELYVSTAQKGKAELIVFNSNTGAELRRFDISRFSAMGITALSLCDPNK